jgi:uncharacterized protein YdeI (YjbR/CyaY-like superfamily)
LERPELYFPRDVEWRAWLQNNYNNFPNGVYLIFYNLENNQPSMRWEEAVKVALCFGWIDSTVKSLGHGKRQQYFCPRRKKSPWSALNKSYIKELTAKGLIHESGWQSIERAKEDGSWTMMDAVENGIIPDDLKRAFSKHENAFKNYEAFSKGYKKSYLSWLNSAKREATRQKRITQIINLCEANIKTRS